MPNNKLLILDTSVLISVLISRGLSYGRQILEHAYDQKVTLAASQETFHELRTKVKADSIKKYPTYKPAKIAAFIAWYKYNAQFFSLVEAPNIPLSRDTNDMMYLQLAQASQADYLISLDEDLLILKAFENTRIATPEEFMKTKK